MRNEPTGFGSGSANIETVEESSVSQKDSMSRSLSGEEVLDLSEGGVENAAETAPLNESDAKELTSAELSAKLNAARADYTSIEHKNKGALEKAKSFLGLKNDGEELPEVTHARVKYEGMKQQVIDKAVKEATDAGGTEEEINKRVAEALRASHLEEDIRLNSNKESLLHPKWMSGAGKMLQWHEEKVNGLSVKNKILYYGALMGGSIAAPAVIGGAVVGIGLANFARKAFNEVENRQAKKHEAVGSEILTHLERSTNQAERLSAIEQAMKLTNDASEKRLAGRKWKVGAAGLAMAGGLMSRTLTSAALGAAAGGKNWKTGAVLGGIAFLGGDYIVGGVKDAYDSTVGAADHAIDSVKETVSGVGDSVSGAYESVTGGVSPLEVAGGVATRLKEDMFMGVDAALNETAPLRGAIAHDSSAAFESFQQTGVYQEGAKLAQEAGEFISPAVDAVTQSETYHEAAILAEKAKDEITNVMFGSEAQASVPDSQPSLSGEINTDMSQIKTGPFVSAGLESLNADILDSQDNLLPQAGDVQAMESMEQGHVALADASATASIETIQEGIKMEVGSGSSVERTLINSLKDHGMSAQEAGKAAHAMVTDLAKEAKMDWHDLNKIVPGAHMEMSMGADGNYHLSHIDAVTTGGQEITMNSSAFDKSVHVESVPVTEGEVIENAVKVEARSITPEFASLDDSVVAADQLTESQPAAEISVDRLPGRTISAEIESMFAGFTPDIQTQIMSDSKEIVTQAAQYDVLRREDIFGMPTDHAFSETARNLLGEDARVKTIDFGQTERGNDYMLRIQSLAETQNKRSELMEALKKAIEVNRSDSVIA